MANFDLHVNECHSNLALNEWKLTCLNGDWPFKLIDMTTSRCYANARGKYWVYILFFVVCFFLPLLCRVTSAARDKCPIEHVTFKELGTSPISQTECSVDTRGTLTVIYLHPKKRNHPQQPQKSQSALRHRLPRSVSPSTRVDRRVYTHTHSPDASRTIKLRAGQKTPLAPAWAAGFKLPFLWIDSTMSSHQGGPRKAGANAGKYLPKADS